MKGWAEGLEHRLDLHIAPVMGGREPGTAPSIQRKIFTAVPLVRKSRVVAGKELDAHAFFLVQDDRRTPGPVPVVGKQKQLALRFG